jgi:hypothetical protein
MVVQKRWKFSATMEDSAVLILLVGNGFSFLIVFIPFHIILMWPLTQHFHNG